MKACFKWWILCLMLMPGSLWAQDSADKGAPGNSSSPEIIRFGFLKTALGSVNENDAAAAIRVWTQSLVKEMALPADPVVFVYETLAQIEKDLETKQVEVLCLTTPEWFEVRHLIAEDGLLGVVQSGVTKETFVVLVHRNSPVSSIQGLKGKTLRILETPRTSMSWFWLRSLMAENGLGRSGRFYGRVTPVQKINKAVLPVFFKQADACLVNRKGFDTMAELNPQIARQIKVVARSPLYVPIIFCFRKGYHSPIRKIVLEDMQSLVDTAAGGQLLTIFQMDGMQPISVNDLAGTISLLKQDQGLLGPAESGNAKGTKK